MIITSNPVREPTSQANEPTADQLTAVELEHVSGGKGGNRPPDYLVVTLKEVIVTQV